MSVATLKSIAAAISQFGLALSILVPVVAWPRARRSPVAWAFFWWLVLGGTANVVARLAAKIFRNNHPVFLGYRLLSVVLLAWVVSRTLTERSHRRVVYAAAALYAVIWLGVIVSGAESPLKPSLFTSPAEKLALIASGIVLVHQAIRNAEHTPFGQAQSWLGIGLVLSGATAIAAFPLLAATMESSPEYAELVKPFASICSHIALILWCIPYWKRGVVWTR